MPWTPGPTSGPPWPALLLLVVPLVAALLLLVPQSLGAYGVELLVVGVIVATWLGVLARPSARPPEQTWLADTALPAAVVGLATLVTGVCWSRDCP
jgi:hypothetical protein